MVRFFTRVLLVIFSILIFSSCINNGGNSDFEKNQVEVLHSSPGSAGSDPYVMAIFNGKAYVSAFNKRYGREVFVTDGTEKGTKLLKDINDKILPAPVSNRYETDLIYFDKSISSYPGYFCEFNGKLYFEAYTEKYGDEPYVTDGSEKGTYLLREINTKPGEDGGFKSPVVYEDKIFFWANGNDGKTELWTSDGTEEGTKIFMPFYDKTEYNVDDCKLFPVSNKLFIFIKGEIWVTNGDKEKTKKLKNYEVGIIEDINIVSNQDKIFFEISKLNKSELWCSDGTEAGTFILAEAPSSMSFFNLKTDLISYKEKIFFKMNFEGYGDELAVSDGTPEGTAMFKDINPGKESSAPSDLIILNDKLYFIAKSSDNKYNIFYSDGTAKGTKVLKDIRASTFFNSYSKNIVKAGNKLYFTSENDKEEDELWCSDGTESGTRLVTKPGYGINGFSAFNDKLLITAYSLKTGTELFISDGTHEGTRLLKDINSYHKGDIDFITSESSDLVFMFKEYGEGYNELYALDENEFSLLDSDLYNNLAEADHSFYDGKFYFTEIGPSGKETILISEGTKETTDLLKDINKDSISYPSDFNIFDNRLFFTALEDSKKRLYISDGTPYGTYKYGNFNEIKNFRTNGESLFINAHSDDSKISLHASRNFEKQPVLISNTGFSSYDSFTFYKEKLVYYGHPDSSDFTHPLFISDGTKEGTHLIKDLAEVSLPNDENGVVENHNYNGFTATEDLFYFTGYSRSFTDRLWVSDGTPENTRILDFESPYSLTPAKDRLFFICSNKDGEKKLMVTKGESDSTFELADIQISPNDINFNQGPFTGGFWAYYNIPSNYEFISLGDKLIFGNYNEKNGVELWISDGTSSGTTILKDLNPAGSSSPKSLKKIKDRIYFKAFSNNKYELYVYDGNQVKKVTDQNGNSFENPSELSFKEPWIYFSTSSTEDGFRAVRMKY